MNEHNKINWGVVDAISYLKCPPMPTNLTHQDNIEKINKIVHKIYK